MKKASVFLGLAAIILLFFSCEKEANPEIFDSVEEYLQSRAPEAETFQLDAASGGTFSTTKGSTLSFPPNSLVTPGGELVTGDVTVRMKEVFSPAEMLYSGIFPVSYGTPLKSGGQFFVEATQNGEQLLVKNGGFINVSIPSQTGNSEMLLFFGGMQEAALDSAGWGDPILTGEPIFPTAQDDGYYYPIFPDSLGWVNCDAYFLQNGFSSTFNLTRTDQELNSSNTFIYVVFTEQNSVLPSYSPINNNSVAISPLIAENVKILVLSEVEEQLHYGLLELTPSPGGEYDIPIFPTTAEDLDDILNSL